MEVLADWRSSFGVAEVEEREVKDKEEAPLVLLLEEGATRKWKEGPIDTLLHPDTLMT